MNKCIVLLFALVVPNVVLAAELSPKGKITGYYTGWAKDQVRVTIQGAAYTEGNCTAPDGYVTAEFDNTGYKTHAATLLAAYLSGKEVRIVVDGCVSNRPRIWGVNLN